VQERELGWLANELLTDESIPFKVIGLWLISISLSPLRYVY